MSALLKVPCILLASIGVHIAVTPPQPPPSVDETAPSTRLELVVKQRAGPIVVKSICWFAAISEIAVILASHTPFLRLSGLVLSSLVPLRGGAERITFTPLFLLGACLACFAGYIRYKCFHVLENMFTFEMTIRRDHRLVTTGPYAVVRHPSYTGVLLMTAGIICMHASPGSWARESGIMGKKVGQLAAMTFVLLMSAVTFGLLRRMPKEDQALRQVFGKKWDEWAKKVSCKLVPYVY